MKALVTGGRGFAASWLAKALLESGAEVTSIDRESSPPTGLDLHGIAGDVDDVVANLRDGDAVLGLIRSNGIDSVFHLAAQAIVGDANASPIPTFRANIEGTWVLLEACREAAVERVVVASSDKAYGPHEELPYTEDSALQPVFPYDVSKAATDLIARSYWHTYGLPVAVTRFANLYGGGDRNFSRLIPETVTAVLDGRPPIIRSDGSPERDFLYVEDAAQAYLAIADALGRDRAGGEAFNAGSGRPHPVREVVELICELGPGGVEPDYRGAGNPSGEIDRQYLDSSRIRDEIGWRPRVELREGLRRTLDWYAVHPEIRPAARVG
ncbi:MAG TPA: NAD-dependent epimerase/dehydratase family protein [Solirubrobacterales bacterium]